MNFFEHQDQARRYSSRLVFLFCIAVLILIALINLVVVVGITLFDGQQTTIATLPLNTHLVIAACVISAVGIAIWYRFNQLSEGGAAVATALGGRLISRNTMEPDERKLLNVVEEMAIASGTPVPPVYLLPDNAINAFAAGYTPHDAVIGITRGAIQLLNRDELQGVIAHEFSHIFNGDMRLNLRLIGVIFGILFIALAGGKLMRGVTHSRSRDAAPLIFIGLGLVIIGYIGAMFGNMIKAAVSRQREYLADASAVQFTRNPDGIGGALKKIGGWSVGSNLGVPNAAEYSHFYIADGVSAFARGFFQTHPPLEKRVKRILPQWDGKFPKVKRPEYKPMIEREKERAKIATDVSSVAILAGVLSHTGAPTDQHLSSAQHLVMQLPQQLLAATQDPLEAYALSLGLIMSREINDWNQLLVALGENTHLAVIDTLKTLLPALATLNIKFRLPLIELCIPSLKQLSEKQKLQFDNDLKVVIRADDKFELWEWALYKIFSLSLNKPQNTGMGKYKLADLREECQLLLATVVCCGKGDQQAAYFDAASKLGINTEMPDVQKLKRSAINAALDRLRRLKPLEKPLLLKALCIAVQSDHIVDAKEVELVRAIAEGIDCPMPPLITEAS
ncbi:MAG: M48 family metallopeptidase [Gammaproteobacteria bacterium]|nr:M48 family metallopeptidase [Gammaproteobacteria bacterium]